MRAGDRTRWRPPVTSFALSSLWWKNLIKGIQLWNTGMVKAEACWKPAEHHYDRITGLDCCFGVKRSDSLASGAGFTGENTGDCRTMGVNCAASSVTMIPAKTVFFYINIIIIIIQCFQRSPSTQASSTSRRSRRWLEPYISHWWKVFCCECNQIYEFSFLIKQLNK